MGQAPQSQRSIWLLFCCQALLNAVPHFDMKPGERLVPVRPIDHQAGELVQKAEPWPADAPSIHLDVRHVTKTFGQSATGFLGRNFPGAKVLNRCSEF